MRRPLMLQLLFLLIPAMAGAQVDLLTNGDFEDGMSGWSNLAMGDASATFSTETADVNSGSAALRADVTTAGTNAWDVQSIHSGWTSVQDNEYTLTFYAKSSESGSKITMVQQNETYSAQDFTLSTEWEQYTWEFVAQENDLQLKVHYSEAGSFLFDDFSITGETLSNDTVSVTVDPQVRFQEMVGFGGGLTWHCDRITRSSHKDEIFSLIFEDLGIDVIRFKNWYYPLDYPSSKSTQNMEVDWFKQHFDATKELFSAAKAANSDIQVLLSSWGPPSGLKSNDNLNEGTLEKNNGQFMYSEYGQYWVDVLDSIGFSPDYISIQNEPGYENSDWTTCAWRPEETSDVPGYAQALDTVYNRIRGRSYVPSIVAPETENIGAAIWDNSVNTFESMCLPLEDKEYIDAYGYHLYNFSSGVGSINTGVLNMIRDDFSEKPNWMTEFSSGNYDWLQTAHAIQMNLLEANTSAYIYWELMWDEKSTSAMISVDDNGDYEVKSHYQTIKHFSKHIDKGYRRISSSGSSSLFKISSFISPDETKITHVLVNRSPASQDVSLDHSGFNVGRATGFQSVEGQWCTPLQELDLQDAFTVPALSITTLVVDVESSSRVVPRSVGSKFSVSGAPQNWALYSPRGILVRKGESREVRLSGLGAGLYFLKAGSARPRAVLIRKSGRLSVPLFADPFHE